MRPPAYPAAYGAAYRPPNPPHRSNKIAPLLRARRPSFFYQIPANTDFPHLALCYNPRNLWT